MIFNSWDWHVKNDVTYSGTLRSIMTFLHYWRMPLLFLISGAGTFYALGKRTTGQYLRERLKRLIIPLIAGIFILVPVQVYIEKSESYHSLLDFYPHMFEGIYPAGNFSWHHLWFIVYLFVISLMMSPLFGFLKSRTYFRIRFRLEKIFSKPLTLNLFIIPLILSELLLRPYFPDTTHALVDDWAAVSYFTIFFLAGFILLSSKSISESIRDQRHLFLIEAVIATTLMFTLPRTLESEKLADFTWGVLSIVVSWSCGITAVSFAKKYLNRDNRFRKYVNEAIYPFYLLHQPVIVVIANIITKWDLSTGWKVLLITIISFLLSIFIYRFMVYPYGFMRLIFGMKPLKSKKNVKPELVAAVIPNFK
jgi:hypothetical protein